jgi:hypothetical protein
VHSNSPAGVISPHTKSCLGRSSQGATNHVTAIKPVFVHQSCCFRRGRRRRCCTSCPSPCSWTWAQCCWMQACRCLRQHPWAMTGSRCCRAPATLRMSWQQCSFTRAPAQAMATMVRHAVLHTVTARPPHHNVKRFIRLVMHVIGR